MPQFRSITFPLGNPEIDDSDRDALLECFMGLPIDITDLPANIGGGRFQGFVEGWTFRASYNGLAITLKCVQVLAISVLLDAMQT